MNIRTEDGKVDHNVKIDLKIRAHWGWILSFILLGLALVGAMTLVAEEGKVKKHVAEVLTLQETVHELADQYAMDQGVASLSTKIVNDLQQALEVLNKPRPLGVLDWRLDEKEQFVNEAQKKIERLQKLVQHDSPGKLAVNRLRDQFRGIRQQVRALRSRDSAFTVPGDDPVASSWLKSFLEWHTRKFLDPKIRIIEDILEPQLERAEWFLLSGEDQRAARLAVLASSWIERAAADLRRVLELHLAFEIFGRNMLRMYGLQKQFVDNPALSPEQREELAGLLSQVSRIFSGEPTLKGYKDVHSAIQLATTRALQFRSELALAAYSAASREAERQSNIDEIADFFSELPPPRSPEEKRRSLLAVVRLWREWLGRQARGDDLNQDQIDQLSQIGDTIDRMEQYLLEDDLDRFAGLMKQLNTLWTAFSDEKIRRVGEKVLDPFCEYVKTSLVAELYVTGEAHKLLAPHPLLKGLEEKMDALERQMRQVQRGRECLDRLVKLEGQALDVGSRLFAVLLQESDVSGTDRMESARRSEDRRAIELARRLLEDPWPLHLSTTTPETERNAMRKILFSIDNLNPAWHKDVTISIDFGDGTTREIDAESMRKQGTVPHRYKTPGLYRMQVKAWSTDAVTALKNLVGEAVLKLRIHQSPVSAARRLAAAFFNLRFLMALTIALLVGTWRFANNYSFGATGRDYLEAFVVGFSSNLGVEGLTL